MRQFKVGDVVEFTCDYGDLNVGDLVRITWVTSHEDQMIDYEILKNNKHGSCWARRVRLAEVVIVEELMKKYGDEI